MFLEPMTVATKPVLLHSILSSLQAIFKNIEESNRPPPGREARGMCHVKGQEKVQAIRSKIPGRWAQGQPQARATNQNCLVYKPIPPREAYTATLEAVPPELRGKMTHVTMTTHCNCILSLCFVSHLLHVSKLWPEVLVADNE